MLKKTLILLLASAALSTAAVRPAFAQTAPTEVLLVNQSGCKLYHRIFPGVVEAQLLNVAGNCVNGFFTGAVLYGVTTSIEYSNRTSRKTIDIRAGFMQQGRFEGLQLYLPNQSYLFVLDQNFIGRHDAQRGLAGYSLAQLVNAINTEAAKLGGSTESRDHLINIATLWDRNPTGLFSTYTSDTGNPRVAIAKNTPPSTTQSNPLQDDPKVFGRSARGG